MKKIILLICILLVGCTPLECPEQEQDPEKEECLHENDYLNRQLEGCQRNKLLINGTDYKVQLDTLNNTLKECMER